MTDPPPLPKSDDCPETDKLRKAIVKELSKLAKEGYTVSFPDDFDHPDGIDTEYEADSVKDFIKLIRKAKRIEVEIAIPAIMTFRQMLDEMYHLDSAFDDYADKDGMLRSGFAYLKDDGAFSRLPTAAERKAYFPILHQAEREGRDLEDHEVSLLSQRLNHDYFVYCLPPAAEDLKTKKKGCLGILLLGAGLFGALSGILIDRLA